MKYEMNSKSLGEFWCSLKHAYQRLAKQAIDTVYNYLPL